MSSDRILPSIAILIAAGIFFAYISPTWRGSIAVQKASIALDDQALAAAEEYKTQQQELKVELAKISQEDQKNIATFLPDSVDNVGLILDLNALAAKSGLGLTGIDVLSNELTSTNAQGGAVATNPVGSVSLSLSATGTFDSLQRFLSRIETSARLLDVQDITVKGSNSGVYTYQMSIRLYWLR
jgi:Tfp pilus assembly protein PilO